MVGGAPVESGVEVVSMGWVPPVFPSVVDWSVLPGVVGSLAVFPWVEDSVDSVFHGVDESVCVEPSVVDWNVVSTLVDSVIVVPSVVL